MDNPVASILHEELKDLENIEASKSGLANTAPETLRIEDNETTLINIPSTFFEKRAEPLCGRRLLAYGSFGIGSGGTLQVRINVWFVGNNARLTLVKGTPISTKQIWELPRNTPSPALQKR